MTEIESPTLPMPARMGAVELRNLRRQARANRARQRDLDQASLGQLLSRHEATAICGRLVGWTDQREAEAIAVRELMRRHSISAAAVLESWRRQAGARAGTMPPRRIPGR